MGNAVRPPYITAWKKRLDIFIGKSIPKLWDWRRPQRSVHPSPHLQAVLY